MSRISHSVRLFKVSQMTLDLLILCALSVPAHAIGEIDSSAHQLPYCGPAAVYAMAALHQIETSPAEVESLFQASDPAPSLSALSLSEIVEALEGLGLTARSYRASRKDYLAVPTPCVAFFRAERLGGSNRKVGHVVILTSIGEQNVRVLDLTESAAAISIPYEEFEQTWDGEYIAVSQSSNGLMLAGKRQIVWLGIGLVSLYIYWRQVRRFKRRSTSAFFDE